ncbi:MAG TPA: PQQ-binding-like beta-propeller repeat protein, partial [Polyangiales bacterium]|nr:PQQ-binding-like beta-propeller repeat protein [Polyangiales bacterium]
MTAVKSGVARWLTTALALGALGCGAARVQEDFGRYDGTGRSAAGRAIRVRWSKPLGQEWGGLYVPVERAKAALDPSHNRLFIGSSERVLWALRANGAPLYEYKVESGIEAEPSVDPQTDELYVPTAAGVIHALEASTGKVRWRTDLDAAISQPGILSRDAVYVTTDDDGVYAIARKDGSILWRFKREPRAGLKIGGHAGLLLSENRLITGFSDGTVAALSPGDGRALWTADTTLDFADPSQVEQGFVDVDTTPVQIGDVVYVASFLGGLYGFGASDGVARVRRADWTAITSIAADDRALVVASADLGVMCVEAGSLAPRWLRKTKPYVASNVWVEGENVYMTETRGALLALSLADGREQGRIQTEHGFLASPS